jgi:hypothetical protein
MPDLRSRLVRDCMLSRSWPSASIRLLLFLAAAAALYCAAWQVHPRISDLSRQTANQPPPPASLVGSDSDEVLPEVTGVNAAGTISGWYGRSTADNPASQVSTGADLWVDAQNGEDANTGRSAGEALRTIQRAAYLAEPGDTVHILPGVYREAVRPGKSGSADAPILYVAENGPGTVTVRGSQPASSLTWTRLTEDSIGLPPGVDPTNIYYTDLSTWGLESPPRFIVELDGAGNIVSRLWPAREPDWQVETEWKVHEFWWSANGGSAVAGCDPSTNPDPGCDLPWRSLTQLTDTSDDVDPMGIEPGNLTTLGSLAGSTLVALDARHAHYVYHRTIIAHDVAAGRITVDEACEDSGTPGLGWGS